MNILKILTYIFSLQVLIASLAFGEKTQIIYDDKDSKIIHGADDRYSPVEFYDPSFSELALSVDSVTTKSKLHFFDSENYIFNLITLKKKLSLTIEITKVKKIITILIKKTKV